MDIVCLGELLIDMFPAEVGKKLAEVSAFRPKPGGAPANVAVAAARLGAQSAFIGKVGDEDFGHFLAGVLQQEGVNIAGMRFDAEARTTMAFLAMPDVNSYDIVFYRNPGADTRLRAEELERELLQSAKVFHFGSLSLIEEPSRTATMTALKIAKEAGALISFDVNYRAKLWSREAAYERVMVTIPHVDLLKINEGELVLLTGGTKPEESAKSLLDYGPRLIVVTLGPGGSYFQTAQGGEYVPAFTVDTVDATGCGDAFIAGLHWQFIQGGDWRDQLTTARLREALHYANAVGALTALKLGVIPALPRAAAVEEFLKIA